MLFHFDCLRKALTTMTPTRTPTKLARLLGVALVATSALGSASVWAESESRVLTDASSRSQAATLNFYQNASAAVGATATRVEGPIYAGSYKLDNGDWVYCLSPLTNVALGAAHKYNKVSLATFLGAGGGYEQQFALNPLYEGVASGYDNQANAGNTAVAGSVINKIVTLYDYAYEKTQTGTLDGAEWAAAFAYALWEIEGEGVGYRYGSATGGLRLSGATSQVVAHADTLLGNLTSGTWSGFQQRYYNFNVYQADPIESSQSFLVVTAPTHPGTNDIGISVPEPSTGLLVAASALAFLGSRRAARGKPAA
jgi:hypothetical protein